LLWIANALPFLLISIPKMTTNAGITAADMLNEVMCIQWRQREQEIENMDGSQLLYGVRQMEYMDYRRDNAEASQAMKQIQKGRDRHAHLQKLKTDRNITLTSERIERRARNISYVPARVGSMHSLFKDDILIQASLVRDHQKETDVLHRTRMQMIIGAPLPLSAVRNGRKNG
jgi:hypothetical protein